MNVLSLFDGMSCARIALERAGITVTNYFASEIDKYAIQVSKANWPDIKHVGSVTSLEITFNEGYTTILNYISGETFTFKGKIDLIVGGSPCQGFSFAGKQLNFKDTRSALFFEYVRLKEESQATYFFLENVVMKQKYQNVISRFMGVQPIKLNAALVSAQNRKRLYWTNIPYFGAPADRGILLKHILEGGSDSDKSPCITANLHKGVPYNMLIDRRLCIQVGLADDIKCFNGGRRIYSREGKSPTLKAASGGNSEPKVGLVLDNYSERCQQQILKNSKTENEKAIAVCANANATGSGVNILETKNTLGVTYRKLTVTECERLQNVGDGYVQRLSASAKQISNTQAYKMLGNGWECNTITYLFTPLSIIDLL